MLETVICFSFLCASPFPAACDAGQGCPAGGPHSGTAVAIAHVKALAGKCSKMATAWRLTDADAACHLITSILVGNLLIYVICSLSFGTGIQKP